MCPRETVASDDRLGRGDRGQQLHVHRGTRAARLPSRRQHSHWKWGKVPTPSESRSCCRTTSRSRRRSSRLRTTFPGLGTVNVAGPCACTPQTVERTCPGWSWMSSSHSSSAGSLSQRRGGPTTSRISISNATSAGRRAPRRLRRPRRAQQQVRAASPLRKNITRVTGPGSIPRKKRVGKGRAFGYVTSIGEPDVPPVQLG